MTMQEFISSTRYVPCQSPQAIDINKPVPPKSLAARLDRVMDFVTMFVGIWFAGAFTALAFAGEPGLLVPAVCFAVAGALPILVKP